MGVCNFIFLLLITVQLNTCQKLITIFSDFTNNSDLEFFKNTFPWIIDNLGSDITLDYHFKDSGKNSGPRKCVLLQLKKNTYLQAEYLRCEATGNQRTECIQSCLIDTVQYNKCVRLKVNSFVKAAEREFKKINSKSSPVILLPRKKVVVDITPDNVLKSICTLYLKIKPHGCVNSTPVPRNNSENESKTETGPKKDGENKTIIEENKSSKAEKNDSKSKSIPKLTDENQIDNNVSSNDNEEKTIIEENKQSNNNDPLKETSIGKDTQTRK